MTILIPLLLMLAPHATSPTSGDTPQLVKSCKAFQRVVDHENSGEDVTVAGYCSGYISGYFAGIELYGQHSICASTATLSALSRVYTNYMDRNPRLLDYAPEVGFYGAIRETYPCLSNDSP